MMKRRKETPLWFAPAVWGAMFVAVVAISILATFLYEPQHERVSVGSRTFVIPPEDLSSFTRDPNLFIRIKRAGKPYEIVHDARAAGRRDRAGVPHIFSVNDRGDHDLGYSRDGRSLVVCRRASSPAGGCGTWISYGGALWSVLLPEAHRGDADRLAQDSAELLRRYDTGWTGIIS